MFVIPILFVAGAGAALLLSSCTSDSHEERTDPSGDPPRTPLRPEIPAERLRQPRYELNLDHREVRAAYEELQRMGIENSRMDRGMVTYFRGRPHFEMSGPDQRIMPLEVMNAIYDAADAEPNDTSLQRLLQNIRGNTALQEYISFGLTHSVGSTEVRSHRMLEGIQIMLASFNTGRISEPELYDYHVGLGEAYWSINDMENAERQFRRAIEAAPQDCLAPYELSFLLWERGQFEESLTWRNYGLARYQQIPEDDPEWIPNIYEAAWLQMVSESR